jgi:ABC-type oligopeptide transport system ATPase subunit
MQQGKLVELGETERLWANPDMPYTQELLQAIPSATP